MAEVERSRPRTRPHEAPTRDVAIDSRYVVFGEIASGGMASVQYGRLNGPHGFTRAVAIKRLHPHFAKEPEFIAMFIDEARLSARLVHANIIHTLDVVQTPGELALVMEYVHGESLWTLLKLARERGRAIPLQIASSLIASVLHGLHAAHEARGDRGEPLHIVHRDVSPQNILIGSDGIPRLLDFGIAKALGRMRSTPNGEIKGKLGYIAPEQLHATHVDRRTDVYGASTVFWEAITGAPLFDGPSEPAIVHRVLYERVEPPSAHRKDVPGSLDEIVLRGLRRDMGERFPTALAMALAIERSVGLATQSEIASWLEELAGQRLAARSKQLAMMQDHPPSPLLPPYAAAADGGTRRIPADASTPVDLIAARPRRARSWVIGATVAVLSLAAAFWAVSGGPSKLVMGSVAAAPQRETESVMQAASAAEPPPLAAPALEAPASEALPTVTPVPIETRDASARQARRAPAPNPTEPKRSTGTRARETAPQPDNGCVPFYNVDERGIRHPKPQCL